MKNDRTAKCEKMSTLNVKSARSAKCENNSTLKREKSFSQLDDQSDGQLVKFGRPGQCFSAFLGSEVSTFQKFKMPGSVMIFTENVKFRWVGGDLETISLLFLLIFYLFL